MCAELLPPPSQDHFSIPPVCTPPHTQDHFIIPPVFIGAFDAFICLRDNKQYVRQQHQQQQ